MTMVQSAQLDTEYDFVYAICDSGRSSYSHRYCGTYMNESIQIDADGKFYWGEVNAERDSNNDGVKDIDESYEVRFFYHDSDINESREIAESELLAYTFSGLVTSPDGAVVERNYYSGTDILLIDVGSRGYKYELVRGNKSKVINLVGDGDRWYYDEQFEFVGWVITN